MLAAEFVLMTDLRRLLSAPGALGASAWDLVAEARAWGLTLPAEAIEVLLRARLESRLREADGLFTLENLTEAQRVLDFARDAGIALDLWEAQNLFQVRHAPRLAQAPAEERAALMALAEGLHFNVETLEGAAAENIH
jgi:hypothetical protein